MQELKEQLYKKCREYLQLRMQEIQSAIDDINDAAGNETKSSAGDKYETAREMMAQEINLKAQQMNELKKLAIVLDKMDVSQQHNTAVLGSIVHTNNGSYYLSIGAGTFTIDDTKHTTISMLSPIAQKMTGLKAGDVFNINSRSFTINKIE